MVNIISVYGGNMLTQEQRRKILSLVEDCCIHEGQVVLWNHLRKKQIEPVSYDLVTSNYERSLKKACKAGKELLDFLNEITEETNEI